MPKDATLDRHLARIQRVIDHIADHLDDPIDLDRLAAVACFSPYHFHRAYRYLLGETVADTVRRLRLHRAAGTLLEAETAMATVARRAGYGSTAAFSRAFAGAYGRPPGAYRNTRRSFPFAPTEGDTIMPDVTCRTLAPIRVAAVRHTGPYLEIGRSFDTLVAWARARQLLGQATRSLGLYHDDPGAVAAADLRADACLEVPEGIAAEDGVAILTVAGGPYAVLRHTGPYAELERSYAWLYRTWLPTSGAEPAEAPIFEEYLNDPRTTPAAELVTDIHLPIRSMPEG
ncbi:AraC family transcriptional regulator [Inquilinus ginsengisoli]|uniref:AraC family transcriptional regulator n=1 Tax=Inquilinus ginsengisoli TaxID=363840 RepID=A0ABU1JZZ7_9PROT|nr:AraC family transcriptional regulator [Inquilinus ginsengisoli]MDR6293862.1 AraC family transcriptional regulator [Inquilinus ginsengisoli]